MSGLVAGVAYPVQVSVNGVLSSSNTNQTFTPNPGRIWFVSLTGNDTTAVANNISRPFRHLQVQYWEGVAGVIVAGDHVIIRGGAWSEVNSYDASWMRFRTTQQCGSQPTGQSGTGWIHFTAYPGSINANAIEQVNYHTPSSQRGGFQGPDSADMYDAGWFISISNMHFTVPADAYTDAAPINIQSGLGPWRAVNNEMGPWNSNTEAKAGGFSGGGPHSRIFGNYIHDINSATGLENHGIYVDAPAFDFEVGYNYVFNTPGGNSIQTYDSIGGSDGWQGFTDIRIHNNWFENAGKYGINLADGIIELRIWNNVVVGAAYAGLRFNSVWVPNPKKKDPLVLLNVTVAFNTLYNNNKLVSSGNANGQILNTDHLTGQIVIANNIVAPGPDTVADSTFYTDNGQADTAGVVRFRNNVWYDGGRGWGHVSPADPAGVYANPLWNNAAGGDFTLQAASPAIGLGTFVVNATVANDFYSVPRPQGSASDSGAFEFRA